MHGLQRSSLRQTSLHARQYSPYQYTNHGAAIFDFVLMPRLGILYLPLISSYIITVRKVFYHKIFQLHFMWRVSMRVWCLSTCRHHLTWLEKAYEVVIGINNSYMSKFTSSIIFGVTEMNWLQFIFVLYEILRTSSLFILAETLWWTND